MPKELVVSREERMCVSIVLPDMVPPSGNEMRRKYRHFRVYAELRNAWERTLHGMIQGKNRQWLQAMCALGKKMRVEITVYQPTLRDFDNLSSGMKPVYDSLVRLQFLRDDSPPFMDTELKQEKSTMKRTEITIRAAEGQ